MSELAYLDDTDIETDLLEAAKGIYPLFLSTDNALLRQQYAVALANLLGSPGEFERYVFGNTGDLEERRKHLMHCFHDNVGLLLSKTWVEAHDEQRKDEALQELDNLVNEIQRAEYDRALVHLVNIVDMIARLMFGEDPANLDFQDYVMRIDPKLGVFYWYIEQLRHPAFHAPSDELSQLQLLITIYALASY